jgi:hemerythrin-like domain-containing protein
MTPTPTDARLQSGRPDTRDMFVVHDALRHAYGLLPGLVRGVAPHDTSRAEVVADHIAFTEALLHHHHAGEDRVLWPVLLPRLPATVATKVRVMEEQHDTIHELQLAVAEQNTAWRSSAGSGARERLAGLLEQLEAVLLDHLAAEEERVLPLAREHLTIQEWNRLGQEGMAGVPKRQLPLVFGLLMYTAEPERIQDMLAHVPAPMRALLPHLAPRLRTRYFRRVHGTATP